jgi:hypothetical protein
MISMQSRWVRIGVITSCSTLMIGLTLIGLAKPGFVLRIVAQSSPGVKPEWNAQLLPDGMLQVRPSSNPAEKGVLYRFTIHTHCGLKDALIDFDGGLWKGGERFGQNMANPPSGFDNPADEGTIILRSENEAEFISSGGVLIPLQRVSAPRSYPLCE